MYNLFVYLSLISVPAIYKNVHAHDAILTMCNRTSWAQVHELP